MYDPQETLFHEVRVHIDRRFSTVRDVKVQVRHTPRGMVLIDAEQGDTTLSLQLTGAERIALIEALGGKA